MTANGGFLADVVGTATRRLVHLDPALRLGTSEAVHDARVAVRRLRSDLGTFRAFVDRGEAREVRSELRWLGAELGAVRDADVLLDRMAGEAGERTRDREVRAAILRPLAAERAAAHRELVTAMGGRRASALMLDLVRWSESPPLADPLPRRSPDAVVRRAVQREWKATRRLARDLDDDAPDESFHELRKQVKRTRYALQASRRFEPTPKGVVRRLGAVQDHLGDIQDAVVQMIWLAEHAPTLPPDAAFVAGQVHEAATWRRVERRLRWRDVWADVEDLRF